MNLITDKAEIIKRLKETNEEWVIKSIKKLLDIRDYADDDNEVIGNVAGEPYTKYQLKKDIEESEQDILNGDFFDHDDFDKEWEKLHKK